MLQDLLALIEQGECRTQTELVKALDVSPILLDEMIRQLAGRGYLEDIHCSDEGCQQCHLKGGCFSGGSQHIWVLTEKGRRASTVP